jgi:nucleolar protein 14
MAKGSQLSQLKSRLSSAGLNRQSQPGGNNRDSAKAKEAAKKRKRGPDDEKKLEKIRKEMNPFEEKTTRVRYSMIEREGGGRRWKGSSCFSAAAC